MLLEIINRLLPQTQCGECGYRACEPYAQALANGKAEVNLCSPGGETVMLDLANLLQRSAVPLIKTQKKALAWIDEQACIGCTACIRACPVDAIMGASKWMHTVLADECTGCGLCVSPCPVDCIEMIEVEDNFLPRNHFLAPEETEERFQAAMHAKQRYQRHTERLARFEAARKQYLAQREALLKSVKKVPENSESIPKKSLNPNDLIAKAMARAQAQQAQRAVPANREAFREQQLQVAQQKAAYRRAQRDVQYGNEQEKAIALAWLKEYKAQQEAEVAK